MISGTGITLPSVTPPPSTPPAGSGSALTVGNNAGSALTVGQNAASALTGGDKKTVAPSTQQVNSDGQISPPGGGYTSAPVWNGNTFVSPTATANITQTKSGTTTAPVVATSNEAESHIANVGTQLANAKNDQANQQAAKSQPAQPATTTTQNPAPTDTTGSSTLDAATQSLLDELNSGTSGINTQDQSQTANINSEEQDIETTTQTAAATVQSNLASIAAGTYPLSTSEQSILSATQQQFEQTISDQQAAMQSAEGMARIAGFKSNSPMMAAAMMSSAIANGTAQINKTTNDMALALAKLDQSYQKEDTQDIMDQWDITSKLFDQRQKQLEDMQTQVDKIATQSTTQLDAMVKDGLTAIVADANLTDKEKQDAVSNMLAQGRLSVSEANEQLNAIKVAQGTQSEQKQSSLDYLSSMVSAGTPMADGTPTIDANGYVTPAALKAMIAAAPSEGLTAADVLTQLAPNIYAPKGTVDPSYGLNAADAKIINAAVPTS